MFVSLSFPLPAACAPSPPISAGFVAASRTAHSVPCLSVRARCARARVSDYSRHLGPPPYSPSLIKEQFHLLLTHFSPSLPDHFLPLTYIFLLSLHFFNFLPNLFLPSLKFLLLHLLSAFLSHFFLQSLWH